MDERKTYSPEIRRILERIRRLGPFLKASLTNTTFRRVTNLQVTKNIVSEITRYGGRIRWKIENEGFNVRKNGGYG